MNFVLRRQVLICMQTKHTLPEVHITEKKTTKSDWSDMKQFGTTNTEKRRTGKYF